MKKIIKLTALIIVTTFALTLAACGGTAPEAENDGKYAYSELEAMSAEELYNLLSANGMTVPEQLTEGKSDEDIYKMVKTMFPEIVRGFSVYDWTVPSAFIWDTHKIYEKIIRRDSPVSGCSYESVEEGFGGKSSLSFNDDGTGYYYSGPLSSYIANGTWTADEDSVTLEIAGDGYGNEGFSLRFRIDGDKLFFIADGGSGQRMFSDYLHDQSEFYKVTLFPERYGQVDDGETASAEEPQG